MQHFAFEELAARFTTEYMGDPETPLDPGLVPLLQYMQHNPLPGKNQKYFICSPESLREEDHDWSVDLENKNPEYELLVAITDKESEFAGHQCGLHLFMTNEEHPCDREILCWGVYTGDSPMQSGQWSFIAKVPDILAD